MNTRKLPALALMMILTYDLSYAQEDIDYQIPPTKILELADYERPPSVFMDSRKEMMVFNYLNTYKTLDELSQDEVRLGGLRVNPNTRISSTATYVNNVKLRKLNEREPKQVEGLPDHAKIANYSWSPDESMLAFTHTTEHGVELWVIEMATAKARRISAPGTYLNASMGRPYSWYSDGQNLLARITPSDVAPLIDASTSLPTGPIISEGSGEASQNRTYQDLLSNPTDEVNFERLIRSELHTLALDGSSTPFMPADLYVETSFSPDGSYLLVTTLSRPFSYIVPWYRFPQKSQVFTREGVLTAIVNEVPLNEVMPKGFSAVRKGRRSMDWRDDVPAQLYFAEALDEGDPANEVPYRDAIYLWNAPFIEAPTQLTKTTYRFRGITWGDASHAVMMDLWYDTRMVRTYLIDPSTPGAEPKVMNERSYQDVYADPGSFETERNAYGRSVISIHKGKAYLFGSGYTPDGQFPFIDELDLESLETKRLYKSTYEDQKEDLRSFIDIDKGEVLVMLQSATAFPNYYVRNLRRRSAPRQLTFFENPFKPLERVHKEVLTYQRADSVELTGTLYLPEGYDRKAKTEKLPLLIWAYPREYKDKGDAGQNTQNPNTFTYPYYGSFVYWVRRGYAVLDNAAFPIVGEGDEEPNDTFIEQLVANAEAAINAVDDLGYIDRNRVGVGGHSYGAFMTANLLTHSDLFACGIARSGAYNRTLTPFGFQSEQRNYWDNPEVYHRMSPFMNAHLMKTPMLLTHGEADNNPGTFTLQTERYFQALKNLGAPARMVILPKESHGYVARPNIMHLLWEQDQFLEKHLKGVSP